MTAEQAFAPAVTVTYHQEQGSWWASSQDVDGFTAAADTVAELRALVREAMPFYLDADDVELLEEMADGGIVGVQRILHPAPVWGDSDGIRWAPHPVEGAQGTSQVNVPAQHPRSLR